MSWPLELLDSVAERGSGHTPSQRHPEYWNGGVKWVSLADSSALDRGYIYNTSKRISALGLQNSSAVVHPAGTVILSRDAGVGKSAILGEEMAVSQHFIAWRCDGERLCEEYLYQWLQFEKPEFERIASGSTVKTIGLGYFKKLRLPVPPVEAQKRIAIVLDVWDAAIERTERLAQQKKSLCRAIMQRLFRDESHPRLRLLDFARRVTRKNVSGNNLPLSISGSEGLVGQSSYFSKRIAAENAEHYTLLRRGEFAYNRSSSSAYPFGAIKRLDACDEGIVSTLYLCFALKGSRSPLSDYFAYYCESGAFSHQIYKVAQEGARNHGLLNVAAHDFFQLSMPVPPREDQVRVVNVLDAAHRELSLLRQHHAAMRAQKRGLMQKLLTGEWRFPPMPAGPPKETA